MSLTTEPEANSSTIVLDASALIAVMYDESGAEAVFPHLSAGCISAVNLCEVLKKVMRDGATLADCRQRLAPLSLTVLPFTEEQASLAASLQPFVKPHNLSLADCCCLSLALQLQIPVLTSDGRWSGLPVAIEIRQFR